VFWKYLEGILEIFDGLPEDILLLFWRYMMGVMEIYDLCPEYI